MRTQRWQRITHKPGLKKRVMNNPKGRVLVLVHFKTPWNLDIKTFPSWYRQHTVIVIIIINNLCLWMTFCHKERALFSEKMTESDMDKGDTLWSLLWTPKWAMSRGVMSHMKIASRVTMRVTRSVGINRWVVKYLSLGWNTEIIHLTKEKVSFAAEFQRCQFVLVRHHWFLVLVYYTTVTVCSVRSLFVSWWPEINKRQGELSHAFWCMSTVV